MIVAAQSLKLVRKDVIDRGGTNTKSFSRCRRLCNKLKAILQVLSVVQCAGAEGAAQIWIVIVIVNFDQIFKNLSRL